MKKVVSAILVIMMLVAIAPTFTYASNLSSASNKYVTDVTTYFDDTSYNVPILHVGEYPQMAIDDVARIIGGTVENNNTLKKIVRYSGQDTDDTITIKYEDGNELAEYSDTHLNPKNGYMRADDYVARGYKQEEDYPVPSSKYNSAKLTAQGHLMLDRKPVMYEGKLYIPLNSIMAPLRYSMHYDRFGKTLKITTGKNYPEPELTFNVKDYGAKGDGKKDDLPAILKAFNAAFALGKPSKIIFEPDKIYRLGSRQDSLALFDIDDIDNLMVDGQGSTLRFIAPTNTFAKITNSSNVKFMNMDIDFEEKPLSQGTATAINADEKYVDLEIDEGFPMPTSNEWAEEYYETGFWYTMVCDSKKPRPKYGMQEYMDGVEKILPLGGRKCRMYLKYNGTGNYKYLKDTVIGDRFLIETRTSAYDVGENTHDGLIHGGFMWIYRSGDITLENINVYGSVYNGLNLGENWGDINLINWGLKVKDGQICNSGSDGIHCWDNRGSLIMDGCNMMMTLDDQINTNMSSRYIYDYNENTLTFNSPMPDDIRIGDELLFVDANNDSKTHSILGSAFVKKFSKNSDGSYLITMDRPVDGIDTTEMASGADSRTVVYNNELGNKESAIVNSKFAYSRRYAWITKSKNSLFAYNYVYENGGSAIAASDERRAQKWEGPFPSAFTMRNNLIVSPDIVTEYDYPVQVQWQTGSMIKENRISDEGKLVDGFLIENNVIDSGRMHTALMISSTDGLYMLNNKFMSSAGELKYSGKPIVIQNTNIEKIDGVEYSFTSPVDAVITLIGCQYDSSNITGITKGNAAKEYTESSVYITK